MAQVGVHPKVRKPSKESSTASRTPSVDFIDNRMPRQHEAFRSTTATFDTTSQRYVAVKSETFDMTLSSSPTLIDVPEHWESEPVELPGFASEMRFWEYIFSASLHRFIVQNPRDPKRLQAEIEDGSSIRDKSSWEEIFGLLQSAREAYDAPKKSLRGRWQTGYRKLAEHGSTINQVNKLIPQDGPASYVKGVLDLVVGALNMAEEVRRQAKETFDEGTLERAFEMIEMLLATFPEDDSIKEASINLVVAILRAVEHSIAFFTKRSISRAGSAIVRGDNYQRDLLESIADIQMRAQQLLEKAHMSSISSTKQAFARILQETGSLSISLHQNTARLDLTYHSVQSVSKGVSQVSDSVSHISQSVSHVSRTTDKILTSTELIQEAGADLRNVLKDLLDDADKARQEHANYARRLEGQLERVQRQMGDLTQMHMAALTELRSRTPSPSQRQLPWLPPAYPPPGPQLAPSPFISTFLSPSPQMMNTFHSLSPQPQMINTFLSPSPQPQPSHSISHLYLLSLLSLPSIDLTDLHLIKDSHPLSPYSPTTSLASTPQFRLFLTSPSSRSLLVHGNSSPHPICPLSAFSATLAEALRARAGYIALVFFCGLHVEEDEGPCGPAVILRSFLSQILAQFPSIDLSYLPYSGISLEAIHQGNLEALCRLFQWLVGVLPQDKVLVCMLDGASFYETDEWEEEFGVVLGCLMGVLRGCANSGRTVKVLVTSPGATEVALRVLGEDDECVVAMEGLNKGGPNFFLSSLEEGEGLEGNSEEGE